MSSDIQLYVVIKYNVHSIGSLVRIFTVEGDAEAYCAEANKDQYWACFSVLPVPCDAESLKKLALVSSV